MFVAIDIVIGHTRCHIVFVDGNFTNATARPYFYASSYRVRPIGNVGTRLRALGAPDGASTKVGAFVASVVGRGGDGGVRWPPVPTHRVEPFTKNLA